MCGIFGVLGFNDRNFLLKATRSLSHRGPDSEGYYTDKNVMLGVRRLSIIDLKKGNQPIYNEDESIVTIFNGEIYNYVQLRRKLEKKGHEFSTDSDTEVIVHAYEEYGKNFVKKLNGMFAIALWDSDKKKLFLYRDRYGIKPLYYFNNRSIFIFSSEIKPILKYDIKPELEKDMLSQYFKYRYIRAPKTFIRQIKKLKPGNLMEIKDQKVKIKKYYDLKLDEKPIKNTDIQNTAKLVEQTVKSRLIADVPIGVFISGGVDSTSVLHFAKQQKGRLDTFTIGYGDETDEFKTARVASDFYNTNHHEFHASTNEVINAIPKVINHLEEPIADATSISTFLLSQFARKKVKTVLTGEGADEVFGGYVHYKNMHYYNLIKKIPGRNFFSKVLEATPTKFLNPIFKYPGDIGAEGKSRIVSLLKNADSDISAYKSFVSLFTDEDTKKLTGKIDKTHFNKTKYSIYKTIYYNDFKSWLPDYILTRVDKMSMAHSLENRVPFLDHELVDYTSKLRLSKSKNLLRKAVKSKLPKEVVKREKYPFYIPIAKWVENEMKDYFENVLENSLLFEDKIINENISKNLFSSYQDSPLINSRKIWSIAMLEGCYKNFFN